MHYDLNKSDAYTEHLSQVNKRNSVVASEDIYNDNGMLLLRKGMTINEQASKCLSVHRLIKPLEKSIALESSINPKQLMSDYEKSLLKNLDYKKIYNYSESDSILPKLCDKINQFPLIVQKITVLKDRLPEEYEKAIIVAWFAAMLAKELRLGQFDQSNAFLAGLTHDIGMLHIDPNILTKPTALTPEEHRAIQSHPIIGQLFLENVPHLPEIVAQAVYQHQERCDGTGYPAGAMGSQLNILGQLVAAADWVYAMRKKYFQQHGQMLADLLPIIQLNSTTHFFNVFQAVVNSIKSANIDKNRAYLDESMPTLIQHLIEEVTILEHWFKLANEALKHLDYFKSKNEYICQNIVERMYFGIYSAGLLSPELLRWMHYVMENKVNIGYKEMEDIDLMHTELFYQLQTMQRVLESGAIDSPDSSLIHNIITSMKELQSQYIKLNDNIQPELKYNTPEHPDPANQNPAQASLS